VRNSCSVDYIVCIEAHCSIAAYCAMEHVALQPGELMLQIMPKQHSSG